MRTYTYIFYVLASVVAYLPLNIKAELGHTYESKLGNITVSVMVKPREKMFHSNSSWWGLTPENAQNIKTYVDNVRIKVGSQKIHVPLSTYADLGNLSSVKIEKLKSVNTKKLNNDFVIILEGGEASTSYISKIYVKNNDVSLREMFHPGFPNIINVRTVYTQNNEAR
jgi:hypothetical protein